FLPSTPRTPKLYPHVTFAYIAKAITKNLTTLLSSVIFNQLSFTFSCKKIAILKVTTIGLSKYFKHESKFSVILSDQNVTELFCQKLNNFNCSPLVMSSKFLPKVIKISLATGRNCFSI